MRSKCDKYPNEDKYPNYVPHVTVAYVKKGSFPHEIDGKNIPFRISRIKYSGMNGEKRWISL